MNSSHPFNERIVHIHIPKTAGTAIRKAFEMAAEDQTFVSPHLEEHSFRSAISSSYKYFSGHIGHSAASQLGGNILVVLRNPIDRLASIYFFWRKLYATGKDTSFKTALADRLSLYQFFMITDEPVLLEPFQDHMVWQLAHGSTIKHKRELRSNGLTSDDVLALALTNLESYSVVGIQEDMHRFALGVKARHSLSLSIERVNVTGAIRGALSRQELTAIERHIAMDIYLYSRAAQIALRPLEPCTKA